jgi:hypothetical protein
MSPEVINHSVRGFDFPAAADFYFFAASADS